MRTASNAIRWALVTFALGITTGTVGYFFDPGSAVLIVLSLSGFFAAIGAACINEDAP